MQVLAQNTDKKKRNTKSYKEKDRKTRQKAQETKKKKNRHATQTYKTERQRESEREREERRQEDKNTRLARVMLHGEAKLGPHVAVRLEPLGLRVLLVQPARVVRIRATNPHAALVVKHGKETLLFALDQVKAVLRASATDKTIVPGTHIVKLGEGWSYVTCTTGDHSK